MDETANEHDPVFLTRRPRAPLGGYVDAIWLWRGSVERRGKDRMLPTGTAGLIVNLAEDETRVYDSDTAALTHRFDGVSFSGAQTRPFVIDTAEQSFVAGVEFRPGGAWPFIDVAQDELWNAHVALRDLWTFDAERLREDLLAARPLERKLDVLEHALLRQVRRPMSRHPDVEHMLAGIARHPTTIRIADLEDGASLSLRRSTRLFEQAVGVSPKRYARLLRFRQVLVEVHRRRKCDWADVALTCGYYDQAHLIRDFRAFSGFSPAQYRASVGEFSNHVAIE